MSEAKQGLDLDTYLLETAEKMGPRLSKLLEFLGKVEEKIFPEDMSSLSVTQVAALRKDYFEVQRVVMESLEFLRKVGQKPIKDPNDISIEELAHKLAALKDVDMDMLRGMIASLKSSQN